MAMSAGDQFRKLGRLPEAESAYRNDLRRQPRDVGALCGLAVLLHQMGRMEEAGQWISRAVELAPRQVSIVYLKGILLRAAGRMDGARESLEQVVAWEPRHVEAWGELGDLCFQMRDYEAAIGGYRALVHLQPERLSVWTNLCFAHILLKQFSDAIRCANRVLALEPNHLGGLSCALLIAQYTCEWTDFELLIARYREAENRLLEVGGKGQQRQLLHLSIEDNPQVNGWMAGAIADQFVKDADIVVDHSNRRQRPERLRIGYLSGDFREHPVAELFVGLLAVNDRTRFEVVAYSYGVDDGSELRRRVQREVDVFVELNGVSTHEAARRIASDEVDILVDLMGHTRGARTGIAALRPAPVQVSWLGFAGTTGASFYDYILVDQIAVPEDRAPFYSEALAYLPNCHQVNDNQRHLPQRGFSRGDVGLPESGFLYCCFCRTNKLDPTLFDVWMKVLAGVPGSVLCLAAGGQSAEANLKARAERLGVAGSRLVFLPRLVKKEAHMVRLAMMDVALDTRLYNGHVTTGDALWAGIPVVTLLGRHFMSRVSASLLTHHGMSDLIARDLDEYFNVAVALGQSPLKMTAIRARLAERRHHSALFNTPAFAKDLERVFEVMWHRWSQGEMPSLLRLDSD